MTVLRRCCLRLRAVARGRVRSRSFFVYALVLAVAAFSAVGIQRADATPATCSSVGVTVAPLHGTRFYIDSGSSPVLDSGYTGVSISPTAAKTNIWVKLSGFAGGELGLNTNQPSAFPLGNLSGGSITPAYFFLTASPATQLAAAQTFSVDVYQGDPAHGGSQLCSYADGYSGGVYDTIQAAANKLQDVTGDGIVSSVSTSSPVIGGAVTLTVEGTTGTLGNGPDGTPFIYETPTSLKSWPAGSFRLTGTTLTLSPGASQSVYTNQLQVSSAGFSAAQDYIAQYTFQITNTTASATTPYPIQEISSGTQVKHTNTSSLASIPAIPAATNPLSVSGTASTASVPSTGGTVTYTIKLHSTSATSSSVDEILDTLPANASFVAGTAKLDSGAIADPTASSGALVFPGPFTVSSAADRTLTFDATLPATPGAYTNSVVGQVAAISIDTTADTSDWAPSTATTTVAQTAQTVSFTQPADTRADQGPVSLSASASSGLAVSFASSTTGVCTVSGTSVTLVSAGTCTITASQAGNTTYASASPVARTFQVTAAPLAQSITFVQPADTRVDQGPVSLSASASSGLSVSLASSTTGVCTVAGSTVTLVATGTCTVTATQAGNASYAAATPVSRSFQVAAALLTQVISFSAPPSVAVDQGPATATATTTSGLAVSFSSSTTGVCTVSGSAVALLAVGTCTLTAAQLGDTTYAAAIPVTRSFSVTTAAQSIVFTQPADTRVDLGPVPLAGTASSGLPVTYASTTSSVCTVSGSSVTLLATGTCAISASQAGNAVYAAATTVVRSFEVTAAPAAPTAQAITFPQPGDTRVDQGPVSLGASASSGLAVSYASSTTAVCTVSGSSVTLVATGTCTLVASQAGDATYAAATSVTRSFQATAAPASPTGQSIAFAQPADVRVDQGPVTLAATASSGLAVSYAGSTAGVCTVTGATVALVGAGTCTITASQAGDSTFAAATPVARSFTVAPAPGAQTIAFPQPADVRVDQGPVSLGASATSGLAVSYASSTTGICIVSGSTVTLLGVGTCTITASQAGNASFAAAGDVTESFQVTAVPVAVSTAQVITFPQPADVRIDGGPVSLGATASSGLTVTYGSATASICTVSGSSVTLVATGTCTITASQAGDSTYAAAADVTRSFLVTALPAAPSAQAITFPQPADTRVDQGPVSLGASASSGLPVSYASTTSSVCTVSGSSVMLVTTGTCTITASQPGDAVYAAATGVSRSFDVTLVSAPLPVIPPATPTAQAITFPQPVDIQVDAGPVSLGASASSGLGITYASSTTATCTVSASTVTLVAVGTCAVTASQAGDSTYAAAADVTRSFAVMTVPVAPATPAATPTAQAITFPSPADTRIDQGPVALTATASSGLAVSFASSTTAVCVVSGSSVTLAAVGTCTIVASQAGDATFAAAPGVARSFAVTAAPIVPTQVPVAAGPDAQSILFAPLPPAEPGARPIRLAAAATSGLDVSFASATPSVCSVSGDGSVAVLAAGICTIVARQGGDGRWLAAPDARQSFAVTGPPLPAPTSTPATTVAGKTTQSVVGGIPVDAKVALDGALHVPGVAAARIVGDRVVVTATKSFSGIVQIPIVVTSGGQLVVTSVAVVVRPAAPTAIAVVPRSLKDTLITWHASASATEYVVRVDGKVVCRTTTVSCDMPRLVAPNERVIVTSNGHAGTRSDDAPAAYAPDKPVLIAIVHFASDSSTLEQVARTILDNTQAKIAKGGYTHAMLTCHTDAVGSLVYNMALSAARCSAVAAYVKRELGIAHVTYRQADFAFLKPAASNSTAEGMAKNRRVEVYVR